MDDSTKPISLLWDRVSVSFPSLPQQQFNGTLPLLGQFSIPATRLFLTTFCYFGAASALYHFYYWGSRASTSLYIRFKSLFNAKKYLDSGSLISHIDFGKNSLGVQQADGKAYAVIYGASTRAGITFAHYLADKGFNLILIERDL